MRSWWAVVALAVGLPSSWHGHSCPVQVWTPAILTTSYKTQRAAALRLRVPARSLRTFFHGPNVLSEERVKDGHLNALTDAASHLRTYASSIFGYALGMDGHQTGESPQGLQGEAFASGDPSRRDKRDQHADSAPSKIHR